MQTPPRFNDKIAVVTGSGRGIGRAIALRLASEGADVVINYYRNRKPAEATAAAVHDMGRRVTVVRANLAQPAGIAQLIDGTLDAFGGLDFLVHNAASGYNRPIMEQRIKGWDWTMNINARAALFLAQKAAPLMAARDGGVIINISSLGAHRVLPDYVLVGASKAALETLTRYLAVELAPMRIVVNAVAAGPVQTDALKHFPWLRDHFEEALAYTRSRMPAQRQVLPEDIAGLVAFLCSEEAFMIRGQTIWMDGGVSLRF